MQPVVETANDFLTKIITQEQRKGGNRVIMQAKWITKVGLCT